MRDSFLSINNVNNKLSLNFNGEFTLYTVNSFQKQIDCINFTRIERVDINLDQVIFLDTAASIFINKLQEKFLLKNINVEIISTNKDILETIELVKINKDEHIVVAHPRIRTFMQSTGKKAHANYIGFLSFLSFIGELFVTQLYYFKSVKNIRFKEIAYELHENGIKALGIIILTSFLIGLVVAYQSAYQLQMYGANIFIVDMLGLSILRELAPLITAIVIAGRSGSAFTAQIGAMKITEELDAMRTMGFDPYIFLVLPRIIALMIAMPLLIFVADIMGIVGGMVVANISLNITPDLFIERFNEVIQAKHFYIGIIKGPFFAFLIASIGIYRGLMVGYDTQSIGFNTTKSVVEAIFAVIICDAIFSIMFTNLGI